MARKLVKEGDDDDTVDWERGDDVKVLSAFLLSLNLLSEGERAEA